MIIEQRAVAIMTLGLPEEHHDHRPGWGTGGGAAVVAGGLGELRGQVKGLLSKSLFACCEAG